MTDVNFSALFQASPYPYLLIGTDFTLLGANRAYLQVTGRKVEDLVGKHIFDAFPANPADPGATNTKEIRTSIERAIKTRQSHTSALLRYAVPRETPEGTVFDNRYWSAVHTPVTDDRGEVLFVVQNAIDVTALYTFDERSSQYLLKQGLNAVPDVTDPGHQQIYQAMKRILNRPGNRGG
jgi:PAS domain S-box-containing protein